MPVSHNIVWGGVGPVVALLENFASLLATNLQRKIMANHRCRQGCSIAKKVGATQSVKNAQSTIKILKNLDFSSDLASTSWPKLRAPSQVGRAN